MYDTLERLLVAWLRLYETSAQPIYYKLVNTVYTHEQHHAILGTSVDMM